MEEKFENAIAVSDFINLIKLTIEEVFTNVAIIGELSKITVTYSGHAYFTLKDDMSSMSCVMFKSNFNKLDFDVEEGKRYILYAKPTIYDKRGEFQLNVYDMVMEGEGALAVKFDRLKNKLLKKGYFDIENKKLIPLFPKTIGIVTSPKAAALQDILSVSKKRASNIDIIIYPSFVQGVDAPVSIANAIKLANKRKEVDTLIVTRGGGSGEDLSAFNDEIVANAIYKSSIPVVSAVGHEIDISIADMVADKRAATPTAAVEMVFPDMEYIYKYLKNTESKLTMILESMVSNMRDKLDKYSIKYMLSIIENRYEAMIYEHDIINTKLYNSIENIYDRKKHRFIMSVEKLNLLSPLNVLSRGYSHTTKDNITVSSINDVDKDDIIEISVSDGKIKSKII